MRRLTKIWWGEEVYGKHDVHPWQKSALVRFVVSLVVLALALACVNLGEQVIEAVSSIVDIIFTYRAIASQRGLF